MISALNIPPLHAALMSRADTPTSVTALAVPCMANGSRESSKRNEDYAVSIGTLDAPIMALRMAEERALRSSSVSLGIL